MLKEKAITILSVPPDCGSVPAEVGLALGAADVTGAAEDVGAAEVAAGGALVVVLAGAAEVAGGGVVLGEGVEL